MKMSIDNEFDEKYFSGEGSGYVGGYKLDEGLELFFKNQISKVKRYCKKTQIKICDIGCAYGFFYKCVKKMDGQLLV
jgi:2-polyprenyl-3-methyl-5-hydroxy-6-metoxy-1,4-benzoquinol methylase